MASKSKDIDTEGLAVNTASPTVDVVKQSMKDFNEAERRRANLTQHYGKEPKVSMYLSPFYQPYLGSVMQVQINGITIAFPVDGNSYQVPKSFADEIRASRMAIDNIITKQAKMSDVRNNFETGPGEGLRIF